MLVKLKLTLEPEKDGNLNNNKGSLLHGVIMGLLEPEYAEEIHSSGLNQFTSTLTVIDGKYVWYVNALNKTAYKNIIMKLLDDEFNEFLIKHDDMSVKIVSKELVIKNKSELLEDFYHKEVQDNYIKIRFITPTAFKSNGEYIFYPDKYLLFKSLMNKYSASSNDENLYDEDTLDEITAKTKIVGYNLKSVKFHMEGIKIPGFIGNITIKMNGQDTMKRFIRMLLEFGEYSGIGIKCSLGMGMIKLEDNSTYARGGK